MAIKTYSPKKEVQEACERVAEVLNSIKLGRKVHIEIDASIEEVTRIRYDVTEIIVPKETEKYGK